MRKLIFGLVAASIALPTVAAAQPGYYGGGYSGGYYNSNDRNGDGYVSRREAEQGAARYNNYYGNNGYYGNNYNGYSSYNGYNAYNGYGGRYSNYYNNGYYTGPTWRGNDGRYYCRRSDGTAGALIGGGAGAVIGSQIAGRGDHTLGAILGGAIGALVGSGVERSSNNGYRCR